MMLLCVAAAVLPVGGQALGPPIGVLVDGGVLGARPAVGRPAEGAAVHVTWFGGLTARTARVPLGRDWDFSADAALECPFQLSQSMLHPTAESGTRNEVSARR